MNEVYKETAALAAQHLYGEISQNNDQIKLLQALIYNLELRNKELLTIVKDIENVL